MLMGPDFFRTVMELQKRHLSEVSVRHTMQSNACLYKGETREVLLDLLGPREIGTCLDPFHRTRLLANGEDYFDKSLEGCMRLLRDGFKVGMVYVVHKQSLNVVRELYYFFRNLNTSSLLVHPVEDFDDPRYFMAPEDWAEFLKRLWEVWEEDGFQYRLFPLQEWRNYLIWKKPMHSCEYGPLSPERVQLAMSPEGDIFPCHRFLDKGMFRAGNIKHMDFSKILADENAGLLRERRNQAPAECLQCRFHALCRSGCAATHDHSGKTRLCEGLRDFFTYLVERGVGDFQW